MVVYNFGQGVGRIPINTLSPVESYKDVEELDKIAKEANGFLNGI